jgi:hypothetical protein
LPEQASIIPRDIVVDDICCHGQQLCALPAEGEIASRVTPDLQRKRDGALGLERAPQIKFVQSARARLQRR